MRLAYTLTRGLRTTRPGFSALPAARVRMPKVPVTSARARTVLSSEPIIPESVQTAVASARRSSRLAAIDAPLLASKLPRSGQQQPGTSDRQMPTTGARARSVKVVASISEAHAADAVEERPARLQRRCKSRDVSKEPDKDDADTAERPRKRARSAKAPAKKVTVKVKKEVAELPTQVEQQQEEKLAQDTGSEKKPMKKNRRAPAGFALRGENVDDSAAARRARLKAAMARGDDPAQEESPAVLTNEIQSMCKELGNDRLGMTAPWEKQDKLVGGSSMWVGCHVSTSGGMERAVINAAANGCRAFAMDTQSKLRWVNPPLTDETVEAFKLACQRFGFGPGQILPHGSYLINLASPDPEMAQKGYQGFLTELRRCERLGLAMYNFHPGSTTGLCPHEESMDRISGFINQALAETESVCVVLENMASVGNIVGGRLWHLRYIIDRVEDKSRIGFCIDTCHLFSSGMDLRTDEACEATFREIDDVVDLKYLRGMHINDSRTPFDSHRDRHENIGRGSIPLSTFRWIMNNPAFQGIPLIMETPVQEREPPVNYKKSLELGRLVYRDPGGPYGVGTDRRDVMLLNSLVQA